MGKNKDIISGLIFAALALLIFSVSFQITTNQSGLSPAAFPRFISVCIFLLALVQIRTAKKPDNEEKPTEIRDRNSQIVRVILFLVSCLVYINTLKILGFVIVTPLLVAVVMLLFKERSWFRIVLVSISTTLILYALFRMIFRVPLPRSFFW